jgi:acetolactate synthase-1/3 small subunit
MTDRGEKRKHTIIALVEDRPGVLNRIASKWRQRGFNIESLAVGHSETPGLSRMTFVVDAEADAEQVVKQVDKLIEVVSIRDLSSESMIGREMSMVKVRADRSNRNQIIELVNVFGAEIVDVARDSVIVEITGDEDKIESFIALLGDFEIIELVRTGRVAMLRGSAVSHPQEEREEEPERYQGFEPPYSAK